MIDKYHIDATIMLVNRCAKVLVADLIGYASTCDGTVVGILHNQPILVQVSRQRAKAKFGTVH